mmetsp:Transcript_25006/g.34463  ORF Transcript_25006/g.34463 Transcript_25006/m.34463 type:complete len:119 (+) Transcript_25006:229-585(+)|eukprot:CAMPEP_0196593482 /NCGR_PEP_ID=MMETSP1081-20130531/75765_1 /TAXON_ID=36882 /ORGANISM="Pyramimonas amylifera, Strain CCMP720" /LENGTH=118 /DNA_ID=CAMNT_0041917481 /DNA_START=229 /DNA_END=585 /DNA_ORIENTATION=+
MPQVFASPTRVVDDDIVSIDEYFGGASSGTKDVSVAKVIYKRAFQGPWQTPSFDEYILLLRGVAQVEHEGGMTEVTAGQSIFLKKGERVKWNFPSDDGTEYIPICLPAFSPDNANREE